ncbi:hypothetical protein NMG60_11016116, partial [Bertholletia excelsa]
SHGTFIARSISVCPQTEEKLEVSEQASCSGNSENRAPQYLHGGVLHAPPPFLSSYPPPFPILNPLPARQPPLLPLPTPKPNLINPVSRTLSCPPANRKTSNRTRDQSRTTKKPKPQANPEKVNKKQEPGPVTAGSNDPLGAEPVDVFTISPPPSSLPLPSFFLRSKLSCNAEASGIDAGATDSIRRMLRLP